MLYISRKSSLEEEVPEEMTWERELERRINYPTLFDDMSGCKLINYLA